jgi:hypothetical protein
VERRKLKVGMKAGIRPSGQRPDLKPRPALVVALIDRPGYRQNSAIVEYEENGVRVELPLARLAPIPMKR